MTKKKARTAFIIILFLGFLTGALAYPLPVNRGISFLEEKIGLELPHFPDIPYKLGLDLQGGTHLVYEADTTEIEDKSSVMQGLRDIMERRVNLFGVEEPVVQIQENEDYSRLIIELAGVKEPSEAIKMIGETPFLEFREERSEKEREQILESLGVEEKSEEERRQLLEEIENINKDPYFKETSLTGQYLERAELEFNEMTYKPVVSLYFDSEGSKLFEEITSRNIGKQVAIYIDGVLLSAPVVQESIKGGRAQITGDFTPQWAKDLVYNLNAGALPVPIELISQQSVGPTLGALSLEQSLKAGLYGLVAIVVFMVIFYKLPGLLASAALLIYLAVFLSIIKLVPVTLTLAGIGGIILSIGMAVDANVLIFSRTREELRGGRELSAALTEGFRRSWSSIRDGSITTLIVALILFFFGTSFIKGFAFTLSIGIVLSMLSALFITKTFMQFFAFTGLKNWKKLWL